MARRSRLITLVALLAFAAVPAAVPAAGAAPVTPIPTTTDTTYVGHAAVAHAVRGVARTPQNPYLAPNGDSGIHNDGWQTNTYRRPGPLGRKPTTASNFLASECASITFDHAGRVVATCIGARTGLYLFDPRTLATLAFYPLPPKDVQSIAGHPDPFNDFSGGGYFYLDNLDRAVIATADGHILVVAENRAANGFVLRRDYNLSGKLRSGEIMNSVLPDSTGRLWFVTKKDGVVGTIARRSGRVHVMRLGSGSNGEIENSFAVGAHRDVYIATNRRLYRFAADSAGRPHVVWSVRVPPHRGHEARPGRQRHGHDARAAARAVTSRSPTTPTRWTSSSTAPRRSPSAGRQVCAVPVFGKGAQRHRELADRRRTLADRREQLRLQRSDAPPATDTRPRRASRASTSTATAAGCHRVWTNRRLAAPSVVPKLSLATGLVYTYTKGTDQQRPLVLDGARASAPAGSSGRAPTATAWASTTTTPASRSSRRHARTSACSAASPCCGTQPDAGAQIRMNRHLSRRTIRPHH